MAEPSRRPRRGACRRAWSWEAEERTLRRRVSLEQEGGGGGAGSGAANSAAQKEEEGPGRETQMTQKMKTTQKTKTTHKTKTKTTTANQSCARSYTVGYKGESKLCEIIYRWI